MPHLLIGAPNSPVAGSFNGVAALSTTYTGSISLSQVTPQQAEWRGTLTLSNFGQNHDVLARHDSLTSVGFFDVSPFTLFLSIVLR